jgi:hypothetical protein
MRWAGHVARIGKGRGVYRILVGKPERKIPLYGRVTLGWIFRKPNVGVWIGFGWLRIQTGGGHL